MIWRLIPHDTLSLMILIKCFSINLFYCSLCHRMYCIDVDGTIEIYFQDSSFSSSIDGKRTIYEQHEFRYHTSISLNSDYRTLRTQNKYGNVTEFIAYPKIINRKKIYSNLFL